MAMGRPLDSHYGDDLGRVIHERNMYCSQLLLLALKQHHPHEGPIVQDNPAPLPPIPNKIIAEASLIAFPVIPNRIKAIQRATLTEYPGITLFDLSSQRRTAKMVFARQVAMFMAKKLTSQSLPEIGRRFGGRDHTTVLHAVRKIERLVGTDPQLAATVERIASIIPEPA